MLTTTQDAQRTIDAAVGSFQRLCDEDTRKVPQWLAYLGEALEDGIGEGWLYDLETLIRERRARGGW